jgi:3',5'-cyclic AMP phosphodiesterase CpdA
MFSRPMPYRIPFVLFLFPLVLGIAARAQQGPWFFAVLADPQMGMYADDQNSAQEIANLKFTIDNLNRLHPRFVVICGDLVNRSGDAAEIAAYKRILKKLNPSIPAYNVAGNHDVGNTPDAATLSAYRAAFGPDHYTFSAEGLLGVVLDSNLIRSPQHALHQAKDQEEWLKKTLAGAKADPGRQIVVFQHIPYFLNAVDEGVDYFNIPQPARGKYLALLEQAGVKYVFAGHYHRNAGGTDGPLTETVTGAVGKPLGGSVSGFRLVRVDGQKLQSQWYCLGRIPNTIDPLKPLPAGCLQQ